MRASPGTFADMSPGGDEDLDWLYGRDRQQAEPERTRVMPSPSGPAAPYSPRVVPDPPHPNRTASPGTLGVKTTPRSCWTRRARAASAFSATKAARHPVRKFFRVLLILLLLFILWLVAVPAYAWTQIARVDAAPSGQRPADQPNKEPRWSARTSCAGLSKPSRGG